MAGRLGGYAEEIQRLTGCADREADLLEHIMRTHIYHSTLDWLRPDQFEAGANEALAILQDFRQRGTMPESWEGFLSGTGQIL
jgi:hypothetical protein